MSILTLAALKPVLLLTVRSVKVPLAILGHALADTADARARTMACIYLAAMRLPTDLPHNPRKRGDYDY